MEDGDVWEKHVDLIISCDSQVGWKVKTQGWTFCLITVLSASFPGVDLLDILVFTYTFIATKYHIYNMVYNSFDITTNFGN